MACAHEKDLCMATPFDPMTPNPYRIRRAQRETHDTFSLELEAVNGEGALSFAPGQFNMLYVFGVGEVPISISGNPQQPRKLIHTTREVGTVTRALRRLKRGDTLGVRGPFGTHWPIAECAGSDVVIVAGGIGLAPLRPALYQLMTQRERFGKLALLYGARTPGDMLYPHELQRWRAHFDLDVYVTVDRGESGWRGNVGVVTTLIPRAPFDPHSAVAFVCGPEIMMRFTIQELEKRGVAAQNIYVSLERNMKCAIGLCGHCQFGPTFVCKDGPVFRYDRIQTWFEKREI
jgi:NAD(P)H-flavin reductase